MHACESGKEMRMKSVCERESKAVIVLVLSM